MNFNFGIVGTEEINDNNNSSYLFADPSEVTPQEVTNETPPKEPAKEEVKDLFSLENHESAIFSDFEDGAEEEEKAPKEISFSGEEKEEEVEVETEKDLEEEEEEPESQFKLLSEDLTRLGIFTEEEGEEEITTPEQFKAKWDKEKKLGASQEISNFLSRFGKKHVDAFNSIYVNGVDPEVYFSHSSNIESYEALSVEDENQSEVLIKDYYRKLGWKNDKIDARIQKLKDYDDLSTEATVAKEYLVENEKKTLASIEEGKKLDVARKAQEEQLFKESLSTILTDKISKKEFDGIPVTQKVANEAYDALTTKKWVLPNGEKLSDFEKFLLDLKQPGNFELAVKLELLRQTNFDFSKIKSKAISKETSELFKAVRVKEKVSKRSSPDGFKL